MAKVLWDACGVKYVDFLELGTTINLERYFTTLWTWIKQQLTKVWKEMGNVFLQHDNTRTYTWYTTRTQLQRLILVHHIWSTKQPRYSWSCMISLSSRKWMISKESTMYSVEEFGELWETGCGNKIVTFSWQLQENCSLLTALFSIVW